jgi:choline dehydrogenase-like flavoprotein
MIRNGETLADGGATQADVAIVGAGAIGIAIATRLAGQVGHIILIEAGGPKFDPSHDVFNAEHIEDARHAPTELNRRRMLGGTTSVWGGRCIPFDPEDFAPAFDRAGWPIGFDDFNDYVGDALAFLDAGSPEFSASAAMPAHPLSPRQPSDLVLDRIERYSKPTNAWRKFADHLTRSSDVTVVHGAQCTGVLTNAEGTAAAGLELRTASGIRHRIESKTIVLACGGLETPRLLLASRASRPCGLGNERDLVGRFYMTHLVSSAENVGTLRFAAAETARAFDFDKTVDGVYGRRMILLTPEARRRESLPNIVFRPGRPPIDDASHGNSVLSAMFLVRRLVIPPEYARGLIAKPGDLTALQESIEHGRNVASGIPDLFRFGADWLRRRVLATRKLPSVFLYRKDGRYPLEFNAEQAPNRESRVMLGNATDSFGMPRLTIGWRFLDAELDAICRAYRVMAQAFAQAGLGEVELDPDLGSSVQRALVPQGGHHIGTVRMGSDSAAGVVDTNCELWTTRKLFVAGTSVLPTSGFANPTLTAVALALRLADHLVRRHSEPANAPAQGLKA